MSSSKSVKAGVAFEPKATAVFIVGVIMWALGSYLMDAKYLQYAMPFPGVALLSAAHMARRTGKVFAANLSFMIVCFFYLIASLLFIK